MAIHDTTQIAYALKQVYGDKITDLFNRQAMTYNLFAKSSRQASIRPAGAGYYFATRTSGIESTSSRKENAFLPEPLAGDGVQGRIKPALIYSVVRLSGLALEVGKGNLAAFVDTQGDAVMETYKSIVQDLNRMCHGDGFGLLGTISTTASPSVTGTWTATFDNDRGVRYIRKGMVCDMYEGATLDATSAPMRVHSINPSTKVVTFETLGGSGVSPYRTYHPLTAPRTATLTTATIASGAEMVRYGTREASHQTTDTPQEMMGLKGMYDDGSLIATFENVVVATYPEFKANLLGNSDVNRELSIDLMLAAMDMTAARSNASVDTIRLGLGQRRKYFGLLANDVRYAPGTFLGGYEKLDFAQNARVKMIIDPYTQPNIMMFEPEGAIKKYELTPIGWGGFEPNKMHWRENYDQATMFLRTYTNLGVEDRPSLTLLEDLVEPTHMPF